MERLQADEHRNEKSSDDGAGSNVIAKAATLMRVVANAGTRAGGVTTATAARHAGIPRPTAHRILMLLAHEGLLERDESSARWLLGPELQLLGVQSASRHDVTRKAREILDQLSRETGEDAMLYARRGSEVVCTASEEGSFPLRSHKVVEGTRFPLGVGSGGLAVLAHIPRTEMETYLSSLQLQTIYGPAHSAAAIRKRIAETRANGYSFNPGLLASNSFGVGAAVFDNLGSPAYALCLTGVEDRFTQRRVATLGRLALEAAHRLSKRIAG
ncbi:helix-turn-helix domain-containing protein [Amycolatopsis sp. RM579]|uniref:Helix-turn-helix domain-containing protein n=2 Tax=Amycolatopsis pithecellobii TaxID=664692 RepID=A0A6N7Z6Y6_9PSEU|nr:helix-turn-helix domain-containing protein [Amycolatopsis pithecellobii]